MGYTDLWKCKVCGTLPEIEMTGKNLVVKCTVCNNPKTRVEGTGLDQVVQLWNKKNDPKPSLIAQIKGLFKKKEETAVEVEAPQPTKAAPKTKSFFDKQKEEEK
jgi:hypothetical protein